jgi:hypothetical protein
MVNSVNIIEAEDLDEKPYDTSNPEQVNTSRKKTARTRAIRLKFVEAAMQHPEGRAWFYDQLLFAKIFSTGFDPDPYIMAFMAGQRDIGLHLLDDVQQFPDLYNIMIKENKRGMN